LGDIQEKENKFMEETDHRITSQEVALMVSKEHAKLLRDIRVFSDHFAERKIASSDFWCESYYTDSKGEARPCYLITKKGCEFIANKLTGQKGTEFTARYVNRFHQMEDRLLLDPLQTEESKTPAILTQIRATPKRPVPQPIPEDRLKALELLVNCPEYAMPYAAGLVKPFIEKEDLPIKKEPVPEPQPFAMQELIHDIAKEEPIIQKEESTVAEPEPEKKKYASRIGFKTPFNQNRLRNHIAKEHISINDLAIKSGVDNQAIQRYLLGVLHPGFENRAKICEALGKPATWLDGGVK
jgi:Rha family phage regulatory protein